MKHHGSLGRGPSDLDPEAEAALCGAIHDAYDQGRLKRLLYHRCGQRILEDIVGGANFEEIVFEVFLEAKRGGWLEKLITAAVEDSPGNPLLKEWVGKYRPLRRPDGPPAERLAAWQLLDSAYFDLKPIRTAIIQAMMVSPGPVLGFGVACQDFVFVNKLRDLLAGHLDGDTQCKDPLNLKPEFDKVARKVGRLQGYRRDLDSVNVLCVVLVDAVPPGYCADFWGRVCEEFSGIGRRLVMLFVGDAMTEFPLGVAVLPPPIFDRDDVAVWVANTIMQIKWPPSLAPAWTDLICSGADDGTGLDIGMVYEAMDWSIQEVRFDAESFRRTLESRMSR